MRAAAKTKRSQEVTTAIPTNVHLNPATKNAFPTATIVTRIIWITMTMPAQKTVGFLQVS